MKDTKGKFRPSIVPMESLIKDIASVREFGISKYGADTWKEVPPSQYRDALMRHTIKYLDNPSSKDEESGLSHLWHIATNVAFLCYLDDNATLKEEEEC